MVEKSFKKLLYVLVFHILHTLVTLFSWLVLIFTTQYKKIYTIIWKTPEIRQMIIDAESLKKRPAHLGIVIVENKFCYETLANIITWCLAYRIQYVSIYDRQGVIKRNSTLLSSLLNKQKAVLSEYCDSGITIKIGDGSLKNGHTEALKRRRIDVSLLSYQDGRQDIVRAARILAEQALQGTVTLEKITKDVLASYLRTTDSWPDPEIAVKFGRLSSMMGYLPWQIRVTEILSVNTMEGFRYCDFRSLLRRFATIEQRMGK